MSGPAIVVDGLRKRFDEVEALTGVDLEVEPATVFGLLGPNGAGKTTTVRVLATVLEPDEGHAEVLGHDVVKEPDAVRRRIGLAGQYAAVDPNLTGRENLRMVGILSQMQRFEIPRAPPSCSVASTSRTPPTARSGPTRVACGAVSTSPPRSWPARPSSSWTSPPPVST